MTGPADREPIQLGGKAGQSVLCAQCQQQIPAGQYYSYTGGKGEDVFLCSTCKGQAENTLQAETQNPNLLAALLFGLAAGLVAGAVWHVIVIVTGYEIGYVAIGVGWLIGMAVHIGSGRKRAASLQILSAVVTLMTLLVANYFTFLHVLRTYLLEQNTAGYSGQFFFISPFDSSFLQNLISPIGLLIWAVALYVAFSVPKPRAL
jgi:hypothetical protein